MKNIMKNNKKRCICAFLLWCQNFGHFRAFKRNTGLNCSGLALATGILMRLSGISFFSRIQRVPSYEYVDVPASPLITNRHNGCFHYLVVFYCLFYKQPQLATCEIRMTGLCKNIHDGTDNISPYIIVSSPAGNRARSFR